MNSNESVGIVIYPWHERLVSLLFAAGIFVLAVIGVVVEDFWLGRVLCAAIALFATQAVREDSLDLMDAFRQMWRTPCTQ